MTAALDSTATVASPAECEAGNRRSEASGHMPVFDAFDDLGLTGRDVAELANVTPPTVSKWRKAKVRIPGEQLAFLTLVLAHLVDEAEDVNKTSIHLDTGHLDAARAQLAYQDVLNHDLPPGEVRIGAQRFRTWWASGEAQKLQDKRFQAMPDTDILDILKKMRKHA
ncbi:MAG: helix-turn-helix transcriptional regulator [Magnetovibrio sp.]|nr:helix-turn-helix transcriptional regulator [Magnetovibrio sp.]